MVVKFRSHKCFTKGKEVRHGIFAKIYGREKYQDQS
jgi:hypothetical protein